MQQQYQHQPEQTQKPDLGCAESESGMEQRLDRRESSDGPAYLSAGSNTCSAAAAVADGTVLREVVTQTGGRESHCHQQDVRHQRQPMHAAPSTSTGSHGAAIRDQQNHVSSSTGTRTDYPSSSPNADADAVAAAATIAAAAITTASTMDANTAESYEQQHVHSVYETIASHFSATRYKPWPFVASFLSSLPPGSVGLDVGCGNGKYLDVNRDIVIIGSDRSANLARIAQDLKTKETNGADVAGVADGLALPFGGARRVDFAICIAVVHHLSTRDRRVEGLRALLDCVRPRSGKVLVYVWALEQGTSRRGWDEGTADQDQLVPWVFRTNKPKKQKAGEEASDKKENSNNASDASESAGVLGATYQRYYHLYRKGELEGDIEAAGGEIVDNGYEKDNWWVIASPKEEYSAPSIESR